MIDEERADDDREPFRNRREELAWNNGYAAGLAAATPTKVWWLPWAPQEVARRFHLAYEQFAPDFGYETRPDTKVFDPYSANGRLMIAVVRNVLIEQAGAHINDDAPDVATGAKP